jgi:hypothetical protein
MLLKEEENDRMDIVLYLSCMEKQFPVANLIHFRGDIQLLQYSNWNTKWILRCNGTQEKKSISAYYMAVASQVQHGIE